jgi:hypothetical protein
MWRELAVEYGSGLTPPLHKYRIPTAITVTRVSGVFGNLIGPARVPILLALTACGMDARKVMRAVTSGDDPKTLETWLTSRLIFLSFSLKKMVMITFCAWVTVLLCIIASWLSVGLIIGRLFTYNLAVLSGGLLTGLMLMWLVSRRFCRRRLSLGSRDAF